MSQSGAPLNFVLIVSDTFRRDHLGCYGNRRIRTPHLDRFASLSVVFDRAYCGSFPTIPARTDLLTGKWTFPHRDWSPLPMEETVVPQLLSRAGYTTMLIVDTPHMVRDGYHFDRGFDGFYWIRGQENERYRTDPAKPLFPCNPTKCRNPDTSLLQYLRNVAERRNEEDYFCAQTFIQSIRWLEKNYKERFFLYIDTFDPHEPWDPPTYYTELYDPGYRGEEVIYPRYWFWQEFLTEAELRHCHALYCGEVTMVDYWIGRLLARLESLDLLQKTVVIFTSDHGFYFGEHGIIGKALIETRDGGGVLHRSPLYDEVARIPLIIYHPHARPARCPALTGLIDLAPTLLDLAGVPLPDFFQGRSLAPLLKGEPVSWREIFVTSWAIVQSLRETRTRAVDGKERIVLSPRPSTITDGEWSLIYSVEGDEAELYHTATDPGQKNNLISQNSDKARDLHRKFIEFLALCGTKEEFLMPRRRIRV